MKRFFTGLILLALLGLISGCDTTLTAVKLDPNGYFPAEPMSEHAEILAQEPFKPEYRKLLYVNIHPDWEKYNEFMMESFKNMGIFEKIVGREDMELLVIEKDLADKVDDVRSKISLNRLTKYIGPFITFRSKHYYETDEGSVAEFEIFDPESGKIVFHIKNTYDATFMKDLDMNLYCPMLNKFIDWANNKSVKL